jgi:uncharacterized protein YabE (DUF348 family)
VSGSRSTWGTGNGGPIHGASDWSSSFTGPARYSPPLNADATDDHTNQQGGPYASYSESATEYATAEYADPYAADLFAVDPYAADLPAPDSYAADLYAPDPYTRDPYANGTPAYVSDYPAHEYGIQADGGAYGDVGYAYSEADLVHTQLLTETRYADSPTEAPPDAYEAYEALYTDTEAPPRSDTKIETEAVRRLPAPHRSGPRRSGPRRTTGWGGRAVQGLVLAALLGGVTAYVAFEKTVNISVDGATRRIHSFASTVGSALSSNNIAIGSHDLVTPAPTSSLSDNSTITVRYGRPVDLTVNGTVQHVWVHATTVGSTLQELGIRVQGARFVAVTAATPIGRSGGEFSVYTMRHITFLADGKTEQIDTTAATVGQAMIQAGITLHDQDTPSVPTDSLPTEGETISIMRITGTTEVRQISIPYTVTKVSDPSAYVGAITVDTSGVDGVATVTYALQIINGVKQKPKEISRVITRQPVAEVEKVGTKALPTNVASLNWAALARCESGGNPGAVDPSGTYYGLYQFSVSTWESLGGTGLPSNASATEQTTRAELLYQRSGAGQWPVCGHNLFA